MKVIPQKEWVDPVLVLKDMPFTGEQHWCYEGGWHHGWCHEDPDPKKRYWRQCPACGGWPFEEERVRAQMPKA